MIQSTTIVRIRDLRLRTYIGFNAEEREKQQDVVIGIVFAYDAPGHIRDDEVSAAIDYKAITKDVISYVEGNRFLLLEKLCGDIASRVARDSRIKAVKVVTDKPHALRFADSVAIEQVVARDDIEPGLLLRL